jgi:hypothetical protein
VNGLKLAMSINNLIEEIRDSAKEKYQSFEEPNFSFVAQALEDSGLYGIKEKIAKLGVDISEDTDLNDDTSIGLIIHSNMREYFLQISVIYPAASFRRIIGENDIEQISNQEDCITEFERSCLEIILDAKLKVLDRETLMTPFRLVLPNTPIDQVVVYNVLFSDVNQGTYFEK